MEPVAKLPRRRRASQFQLVHSALWALWPLPLLSVEPRVLLALRVPRVQLVRLVQSRWQALQRWQVRRTLQELRSQPQPVVSAPCLR